MPWDDYGSILAWGMSTHLPRKDGLIQLERTASFVPPITFPGLGDIVVTNGFREALEVSGLTGFTFAPIIKARIVESNWETWDRGASNPNARPPGGEPEDYILASPHEPELANRVGVLWGLVPGLGGMVERRELGPGPRDVEILLRRSGADDFFRAKGARYNYVTQRAMEWLVAQAGEWVEGLPARVEREHLGDEELLEALRERGRVAPRRAVGARDTPKAFQATRRARLRASNRVSALASRPSFGGSTWRSRTAASALVTDSFRRASTRRAKGTPRRSSRLTRSSRPIRGGPSGSCRSATGLRDLVLPRWPRR